MRSSRILLLSILALSGVLAANLVRGRGEKSLADAPIAVTSVTTADLDLRLSVVETSPFDVVRLATGFRKDAAGKKLYGFADLKPEF
jgi:hypothetical protein